jgi:cobalt-zinc-cadmium resistance protein CzcA
VLLAAGVCNVQGRDLGGFVAELQQRVGDSVSLPSGYYLEWGGQFQNMDRAMKHLMIIIPITIAAIFFLLFLLFSSLRLASLIMLWYYLLLPSAGYWHCG